MIDKILNEGLAWLSVALGGILTLKYIVRMGVIKSKTYKKEFILLNKYLRNTHIYIGVFLIITGMIHGIYSSDKLFSINLGTICWVFTILLGISWSIRKVLKKPGTWIRYHRALTVLFIVSLGLHLFDIKIQRIFPRTNINNYQSNESIQDNINNSSSESLQNSKSDNVDNNSINNSNMKEISGNLSQYNFRDGTYEGVANGYGPNLTVRLEIKNNKINNITIVSHNEDGKKHYGRAMDIVPNEIIDNQSVDVDTISGATYTSDGIINAVKNALLKAII